MKAKSSMHANGVLGMPAFDPGVEVSTITAAMREALVSQLRRRGYVVAVSGGVDSAVCAALAAEAVGPQRMLALLLPERDSSPESTMRGREVVEQLGIEYVEQDIAPALEAVGCYHWRDSAIRELFPEYGPRWRSKIAIRGGSEGRYNHFVLVVQRPGGEVLEKPMRARQYLQVVAATNYKQRIRKSIEYFHADRLNYAVVGTPNRLEYDQGFFVKNGDGAADIKPIAGLYKTQVYALARHLGLPDSICQAEPTTDTYSMQQGQDEFYFALPYKEMDLALMMLDAGQPAEALAGALGVGLREAECVYQDIRQKRAATRYLHEPAVVIAPSFERPPVV